MSLTGKVALVTGATKGIGKSIVENLHAQGASVIINYSRDSTPAQDLLQRFGPDKAIAIKADVSNTTESQRLVSESVAKFGKIDILVLNAGVLPMKDLASTTEDDFDRTFGVNVKGPYFITQAAVPHIPDGGRVIFFSTTLTVASTVTPNYLLYNATKGAIEQIARVLAKDLGKRNIAVNVVSPGPTGTDLFYAGKSEAAIKMFEGFNPMGRIGTPEEVAKVVGFLAGPDSSWVNGQNIRTNGGMA